MHQSSSFPLSREMRSIGQWRGEPCDLCLDKHVDLIVFIPSIFIKIGRILISIQLQEQKLHFKMKSTPGGFSQLTACVQIIRQTWTQHELTAASSLSSKILVRMSLRRGTVMIRMKGKAREATVDFTTHSRAIHNNWMMVNIFIRHVFTCMWNKSCNRELQGLVKSFYFALF